MKTLCVVLITLTWLTSWTGIMLGLAGCLTPPAPEPGPVLVSADR